MTKARHPELLLVIGFLAILGAPGILQTVADLRRSDPPQALNVFRQPPTARNLRSFERELEDGSVVARELRPWVQYAQFAFLKDPGDKALLGRDGWLFYKPGFRYLTERPPTPAASSNALTSIIDFRDQLARRGIRLLVVPAPNKESIHPEKLSARAASVEVIVSPQTRKLIEGLRAAGVDVVDLFEAYRAAKKMPREAGTAPLYLAQDSHWSPSGVEVAARAVAQRLLQSGSLQPGTTAYKTKTVPVSRLGDIVRMLQVPQLERSLEQVVCEQVLRPDGEPYRDDPSSEILLLGDSFLRIYEQDAPGGAGFIAHLARELRQPLTSLVNDGGASTLVRQELFRRPALLQHKRWVIWEFVERDIRFGTEGWQPVPLPPDQDQDSRREIR